MGTEPNKKKMTGDNPNQMYDDLQCRTKPRNARTGNIRNDKLRAFPINISRDQKLSAPMVLNGNVYVGHLNKADSNTRQEK